MGKNIINGIPIEKATINVIAGYNSNTDTLKEFAINDNGSLLSSTGAGGNGVTSDITSDAWGKSKSVFDFSLFHSLFTYNIPRSLWLTFEDGIEVNPSTRVQSIEGQGVVKSGANIGDNAFLRSRRHPRYQPNRGHLYSASHFFPNPTANGIRQVGLKNTVSGVYFQLEDGILYAVLFDKNQVKLKEQIDLTSIGLTINDLQYGHLFDIQFQWRGIGDYFFYINQKLVYKTDLLGSQSNLSILNPALSAGMYCENTDGTEVEIKTGCVDITSEGGKREGLQYKSAVTPAEVLIDALNKPLIIVRNVKEFLGKPNTRDCLAFRFTGNADQRIIFKAWITRDPTAITGGTYDPLDNDTVMERNVSATSVDITKMQPLWVIRGEQYRPAVVDLPSELTDFYFTEGDYLVFTANRENPSQTANATATVEFGEEI